MAAAAKPKVQFSMSENVLYPEGKHLFQVVDYTPSTGNFGPQLKWTLELLDFVREDDRPPWIFYYTGMAISQKTKLGKLLLACRIPLPRDADEAESVDPNALIGKQLFGTIIHKMGGDGMIYSNIADDSLLPAPKAPTKAAPAPVSSQASPAAAVTAGEDAKIAAIIDLMPTLHALEGALAGSGTKLTSENTGPGLKRLTVVKNSQKVYSFTELDFSLVSLAHIGQAKAEATVLLQKFAPAAETDEEEVDPFAVTGDVEE